MMSVIRINLQRRQMQASDFQKVSQLVVYFDTTWDNEKLR